MKGNFYCTVISHELILKINFINIYVSLINLNFTKIFQLKSKPQLRAFTGFLCLTNSKNLSSVNKKLTTINYNFTRPP